MEQSGALRSGGDGPANTSPADAVGDGSGETATSAATAARSARTSRPRPFPHRPSEEELAGTVPLMVRNLVFRTRQEDLLELFSPHGTVVDVFIPWDHERRRIRGFAFVRMQNAAQAEAAIQALDGAEVHGRTIMVKRAEYEKGQRPPNAPSPTAGAAPRGGVGASGGHSPRRVTRSATREESGGRGASGPNHNE
ncbi:hypothetical protein CDCA_CDCA08G2426 [Cyanidium caldarium]|uniref:RRM domain-containing protein n=1 Tax=Cyanidium caldarium TaxID=2771 RepID=A0AAV9IWB3_CYACA|nr:hypothetical protein CDCA_CDCA08G2426 [Cyanidium caldarium]